MATINTYRGTCSIKVEYTADIIVKPGMSWLDAQLAYIEQLKRLLDEVPNLDAVLSITYPMMELIGRDRG
jgi:hypothetical protein